MCGLAGLIHKSGLYAKEQNTFANLLQCASFRGMDSTGVIRIQKDYQENAEITVDARKYIGSPLMFHHEEGKLDEKDRLFKQDFKTKALIGHCRSATIGKKTVENAHPFRFEHIIGMQNGTIHRQFKHSSDFETDTEALFFNINEYGIDEAIQNVESERQTAYSLVWYDFREETINFLRNEKRPLEIAFIDDGKGMVWGSEEQLVEACINRNNWTGVSGWKSHNGKMIGPPFTIGPNRLFSFSIRDINLYEPSIREIKFKKLYNPPKPKIKHKEGRAHYLGSAIWDGFSEEWQERNIKVSKAQPKVISVPFVPRQDKPKKYMQDKDGSPVLVPGFKGAMIPYNDFVQHCEGCTVCEKPIDPRYENIRIDVQSKDRVTFHAWDYVAWWDNDSIICSECQKEDWVCEYILAAAVQINDTDKKLHDNAARRLDS